MGDRGTVGLLYPISHLRSSAAKAALADGVREVADSPSFAVGPKGPPLRRAGPIFRFATKERWSFWDIAEL